jgi:hypothetical protein
VTDEPIDESGAQSTAPPADLPAVGWADAAVAPGPVSPSGLIPIGAALAVIGGIAGVLAVILPYANFIGGDGFALIPLLSPGSSGASLWLGIEPLALAVALVLLGFVGLLRPVPLIAGLTLGLGVALLLNHGGFLVYLVDPAIDGNPEAGLIAGVAAGAVATLGGLISIATRPRRDVAG